MVARPRLRDGLEWGKLRPLRLRARTVAEGLLSGQHASTRRGSGVELGGHRSYVPGDDLRWLDRKALLRHDKLVIRHFETETERALMLVVDASGSMGFRSDSAPGTKLEFASLLAAALARVAASAADPVGLACLGGSPELSLPIRAGSLAFESIAEALDEAQASGDLEGDRRAVEQIAAQVAQRAPRGSTIIWLSDLLGFDADARSLVAGLATRRRTLVVVRVLDPVELAFPFSGPVLLRASEGDAVVETDAAMTRKAYLAALAQDTLGWESALVGRGARLVSTSTEEDPVEALRRIVQAAAGPRTGGPR